MNNSVFHSARILGGSNGCTMDILSYPRNTSIMKHSPPEASNEGEMRNKEWQNKCFIYGNSVVDLQLAKTYLLTHTYAPIEDSDQPAHLRMKTLCILYIQNKNASSEDSDQTARLRSCSESLLGAHVRLYVFWRHGKFINTVDSRYLEIQGTL